MARRPGVVPSANAPMIAAPWAALPVESAYTCTAWVNPQGRR